MREAADVVEQLMPDGKTAYRWVDLTEKFRMALGHGIDEMVVTPREYGFYSAVPKKSESSVAPLVTLPQPKTAPPGVSAQDEFVDKVAAKIAAAREKSKTK
jgi:hypothetical protein